MHHGPNPWDEPTNVNLEAQRSMEDALRAPFKEPATESFGATGRFPEGQLRPDDEGEIRFGVAQHGGKVVISFGKPTAWIGMSPQQARHLAKTLRRLADEARRAD
jgi:hypothetical protein